MPTTEMPLFPLSAVLLPYGRMPLQIFEQRYLDLIRDCMRNSTGFGVVWLRRGEEVAPGPGQQQLGDTGTVARIVDFDQLPNGLLGVTIQGGERFRLSDTRVAKNGLVLGDVSLEAMPEPAALDEEWSPLRDILESLGQHPHVRRMGIDIDFEDAWQVGYTLAQLLPLEESLKYSLLNADDVDEMMDQLDLILSEISGEG
jgi:Lon protease-like protein